jgi:tetratricopeptide (TPR) repeat protein
MRPYINAGLFVWVLTLTGCLATSPVTQQTRIDEVPMYGGIDRLAIPELKAADAKFISDVSAQFGSRETAAVIWIDRGFKLQKEGHLGMAMRRFNQAWLLNPKHPEAYAGFASVLHDQGKNCESMKMMDKALELDPPKFQGIYPDAGRIVTLCAVSDKNLAAEGRKQLFERSEKLYQLAESIEPNKHYLYASWASAYYWRAQYADAWKMVAKERAAGGSPNEKFLGLLMAKMPDPENLGKLGEK